ncbi:MAG: hypothetical protein CME33_15385 [Gimesia sp.]|uniref:hypothetical protein n=1 Tax=Gimesia sp. TaxID=2024833 RepID=UPI000C3566EC|nr:hypothetical protein [Gimesia sp.]MAX37937.1 hypothetical protein [Gimesia sp.]|tara:strand:- start:4392 stop:4820 length:429 start_codon:yes stop_codon:yes gene_type:complete
MTDKQKAKLIVYKISDYAEIGGMQSEHSYMLVEAMYGYFDNICFYDGNELTISNLLEEVRKIIVIDERELTDSEKVQLIVSDIVDYAEIGGLDEDADIVREAVYNCLVNAGDESTMTDLLQHMQKILDADEWPKEHQSHTDD